MTLAVLVAAARTLAPGAAAQAGASGGRDVTGIAHDSRAVTPGAVFVAIRGHRLDGETFVQDAERRGAIAIVAEGPAPAGMSVPWLRTTDARLALVDRPDELWARISLMVVGIVGNGLAGALYIGAHLGTGPRDGLWLGLVRRTGRSIRLWRTLIELTVLVIGFVLGGTVGVGTVLYALAIGPTVQLFLPLVQVRGLREPVSDASR